MIEQIIKKNDSVRISSSLWLIIFVTYWVASMILTFAVPTAINSMVEYYNVVPSQFSVLLYNIVGILELVFAVYMVVFTAMIVFGNDNYSHTKQVDGFKQYVVSGATLVAWKQVSHDQLVKEIDRLFECYDEGHYPPKDEVE